MSSWRDSLRPGTYRGVTFFVDAHESEHGRRVVSHEYPGRALPGVEDFGRSARRYRVDAFLLGDDSHLQRDRLIAAVERFPTGWPTQVGSRLVHPYLGELDVVLLNCRVRQSARGGRMVRVDLEFVEAGTVVTGVAESPPVAGAKADQAALKLEADAQTEQAEKLLGTNQPQAVQDAAVGELTKANAVLASIDVFEGPTKAIQAFQDGTTQLIAQASTLVTKPAELAELVFDTVAQIEAAVGNALGALEAYRLLLGLTPTELPSAGGLSQVAADNAAAVLDTFRLGAAGRAVAAAARAPWPTLDAALTAQQELLGGIDELLGKVGDDVYQRLQTVRARLVADVPQPGQQLPRLVEVVPGQPTSTILLAYAADGDLDQELALAERSMAEHPGFLPAGEPVQVVVGA